VPEWIKVALLGIIEGVTEFLPVSSTGHLLIAEKWLGHRSDLFNVVIQSGAVLAVLMAFSGRMRELLLGVHNREHRDYLLKLAVAFVITATGGLILKALHFKLPETAAPVAWATLVGGVLILVIEALLRDKPLKPEITWSIAVAVGLGQLLAAVLPGLSRSGATILIALALGLQRRAATEFSFLLGIPTLLAAGGVHIYSAQREGQTVDWGLVLIGAITAAITAFLAVRWLLRYVQSHTFKPFGWYRILLGIAILIIFARPAMPNVISTVAGTGEAGYSGDGAPATKAKLNNPFGIARGPDGALYICDTGNHVIRRVDTNGIITTVAGTGRKGYSGDGGPALKAELNEPYEVRFDKENMYFVEMRNHVVRRVDIESQTIATLAGNGRPGFGGDGGPGRSAMLNQPHAIQLDQQGHVYICDIGNHRIRKVDSATGLIFTFLGTGAKARPPDGAKLAKAPVYGPRAIDFDAAGNLWLVLREGNAVYKIDMNKSTIHHVAGTGEKGNTTKLTLAKRATFSGPKGLSVAPDGNVYLADTEVHRILKILVKRDAVEPFAGSGERGDGPDGDPLKCKMARPHGVFVDADGSVFVGDSEAHRVRLIRSAK
jgi:undecaprenyl-diphosphatase UppP